MRETSTAFSKLSSSDKKNTKEMLIENIVMQNGCQNVRETFIAKNTKIVLINLSLKVD